MKIPFYKYQGTGNDFVMIDNRTTKYLSKADTDIVKQICDRRFGIGADGLILLQEREGYDFEMVYFNADGNESTMCGNGGRCIVNFAHFLNIIEGTCHFLAIDGPHDAKVEKDDWVELKMSDVKTVEKGDGYYLLNTGSPHYVIMVEDVDDIDVVENGQAIRYSKRFKDEGVNVNFVERTKGGIIVATYERGVEDETLSCGTGVTAAAISYYLEQQHTAGLKVQIQTKGGELMVRLEPNGKDAFQHIWLCGKAEQVFKGEISI